MAEADGEVAVRDPNQVISEIETTRENLARTIDALTERVSPGNVARQTMTEVREQLSRPQVRLAGGAVEDRLAEQAAAFESGLIDCRMGEDDLQSGIGRQLAGEDLRGDP